MRAEAADSFDKVKVLNVRLSFAGLFYPPVVIPDVDFYVDDPFSLDDEPNKLRLFLQRMIRAYGYVSLMTH